MRVLGLATKVSGTAITVSAVVLEGVISGGPLDLTSVVVSSSFEFKEDFGEDLASLLGTLAKKVSGRIRSIDPDVVVVRRADWNRNTGGQRGPRLRLLAEGAITGAAHEVVQATRIRTGKECGTDYGASKAQIDADASQVHGGKYSEATAAALCGLVAGA